MSLNSNINKQIIQVGTKIYSFPRMHYETDNNYFTRVDFFKRVSPKSQREYIQALNMSMVWANMKILKCIYKPEIIEKMNKMVYK